ncbi:MAG: substrate-binding domain-containing protein [Spirulina sp.]
MLPQKKKTSIARLLFQLTLAAASALVVALPMDSVAAQSLAPVIPEGTVVRIDGSSSMATVNETLKQYIETQYPETRVIVGYRGPEEALKALKAGEIDFAAIGRPLTADEKAEGFLAYPLSRRKIAIVVSADNAFEGSLSYQQFARIFRGEIDDWSEIGGDRGQIRFIDRPVTSDTRRAFLMYPVFQNQPFDSGDRAVQLEKDSTLALIKELDANAIGYTIADQAIDRPELRILLMHDVSVTEESYPFSQPRYYAYHQDDRANTAVKSFLGLIATPHGQQIVESAKAGEQTAISAGLLALAPDLSGKTPSLSANVEDNLETEATIAAPETNRETPENESPVAIAPANSSGSQTSEPPEENTVAQTRPEETNSENKDDNAAILWWLLGFLGLVGLVWLWLNKQKAASFVQRAIASLPGQPPPIALAPGPKEPETPSETHSEPTPTPEAEKVSSPPVVPPAPPEPPKVEETSPPAPVGETPAQPDTPAVSPTAIAGAAAAIGAGAAAIAGQEKEPPEERSGADKLETVSLPSNCYGTLTVNSKSNCYVLDTNQLAYLESGSNTLELTPGVYVIRIESGLFNYWPQFQQKFAGEPWVLLWFYGGKFINKKTNLEVGCTWTALNGYDDTMTLEVIETLKLSALFFDTYKDDNEGKITLSILKDE